jgi:phosphoglycolate phosphatase/beta-phosphoglucomutase
MIKAILMDFNGVVIDDEQIQCEAYREVFKEHGIELTDEGYYARMGMNDRAFVASVFEAGGRQPDEATIAACIEQKTDAWQRRVADNPPLFDGVENFVKKCAQEMAVGLVSMARRSEIDLVLGATGLAPWFSVVLSAEDIGSHKPDPECYREGFRRIDLHRIAGSHLPMVHKDCLVVEDSPAGVRAGKAADLPVLAVENSVPAAELRAAGADAVATHLDDWMPETLRRVFQ